MLCGPHLRRKQLLQFLNVDFSIRRVANHAHQSVLQGLDLTTLVHQALQVIVNARFLVLKLLVLVLGPLELLVELSQLPIGEVKLSLLALDVLQDEIVRLI